MLISQLGTCFLIKSDSFIARWKLQSAFGQFLAMCFRNPLAGFWGSFLRFIETRFRNSPAGRVEIVAASHNPVLTHKGLPQPESLLILHNQHPPPLLAICPACQLMRHITLCNSLLLGANCRRPSVPHSKIGSGGTCAISRVEVAPMRPSLEPSLPVLSPCRPRHEGSICQ